MSVVRSHTQFTARLHWTSGARVGTRTGRVAIVAARLLEPARRGPSGLRAQRAGPPAEPSVRLASWLSAPIPTAPCRSHVSDCRSSYPPYRRGLQVIYRGGRTGRLARTAGRRCARRTRRSVLPDRGGSRDGRCPRNPGPRRGVSKPFVSQSVDERVGAVDLDADVAKAQPVRRPAVSAPSSSAGARYLTSSSLPVPSGVRTIATSARTPSSPLSLETVSPRRPHLPSLSNPRSRKNAVTASRSSTATPR